MKLRQLISQAQDIELEIIRENAERKELKESEMYQIYADQITGLTQLQEEMLADVPDSSKELYAVKQDIIKYFKDNELEQYDNCFAKFKTKNSVNSEKLLNVLGGDIDTFVVISDVSQKKLKDYARDNKDIKKALLGCIQEDYKELVDVTIKYS